MLLRKIGCYLRGGNGPSLLYGRACASSSPQTIIQPTDAAPEDEWSHEIPAKAKAILEGAAEFELLSLDPQHDRNSKDTFLGWRILGKTEVEKLEVRKKLLDAFEKGVNEYKGDPAHCFNPRHEYSTPGLARRLPIS